MNIFNLNPSQNEVRESANNYKEAIAKMSKVKEAELIGSQALGVTNPTSDIDIIVMLENAHLVINQFIKNTRMIVYSDGKINIPNVDTSKANSLHNQHSSSSSFNPDVHVALVKLQNEVFIDVLIHNDPVKFQASKYANELSIIHNKLTGGSLKNKMARVAKFKEFYKDYMDVNTKDD